MKREISTGDIIKLLLDKHNISIKKLSEISGVPIQSLYTLRNKDTRGGSIDTFSKICRSLNEPLELFTEYDSLLIDLYFKTPNKDTSRLLDDDDRLLLDALFHDYDKDLLYLSAVLRSMGESKYTNKYLTDIYNGKISIEEQTFSLFLDILNEDVIINLKEWKELTKFRKLKPEQQDLIKNMHKTCVERNHYWWEYINSSTPVTSNKNNG